MEKNASNWHPGLSKRSSIQKITQEAIKINKVNNYMCCKLNNIKVDRISEELRVNKWRHQTHYPIFKIYHFSYQNQAPGRAISKVVYELPQVLLFQLSRPLPLSCCLYIIKSLLLASQKLIQQFGCFRITQKMVGITREKNCKMWINQNIESNHVMFPAQYEQDTVDTIKHICQTLINRDTLQKKFISELRRQRHNIIRMNQLIWQFSYQNNILIPPFFENKPCENINRSGKINHKKTRSLVPSPSAKKIKTQVRQSRSQHRYSQNFQIKSKQKILNKTIKPQTVLKDKKNISFKLNKSSHVNLNKFLQTSRERGNSRSDFITRRTVSKRESECSKSKQNLTKTTTSKQDLENRAIKRDKSHKANFNKSTNYQGEIKDDQKIQKMKNMIKQKIRLNREKKKVVKLQAVTTVKSIGQFTESEKKIIEQSQQAGQNKNNFNLQILNLMCKKVGKSQFHIQNGDNADDFDEQEDK